MPDPTIPNTPSSHTVDPIAPGAIHAKGTGFWASPQGNADVIESPVKTYARDVKSMVDHAPLSTPAFSRTIRFFSVL
ncbi:hypothetical protein LTR09_007323 [Extremus antarcticus]|uniref:Uncharacterized protein n=1 Tax=Extremus antarcticus TaxID=702011 RepID=A0AAJ0GB76_9PEZI|nr:hypothetical protein LTR09_007323 [Extremus antarcticus]